MTLNNRASTRVTIKDVAALAGTSTATVSYVLNNSKERYITAQMRARVEDAVKSLGYVKSAVASGLKGKKMGVIAFLTPQFDNHFFLEIFFAIEEIANEMGYVLSVCNTFDDPTHEKEVLDRMEGLLVDAYIIIPTRNGTENIERLEKNGVPYVCVERPVDIGRYDFVSSDNYKAGYDITSHLINMGHRRIALSYWDSPIVNLKERLDGYKKALLDNDILYDESLVKVSSDISIEIGENVTREILIDKSITAIFYSQYLLGEGGIRYLKNNGISIPERVSICVLGAPKWAEMFSPTITHIHQPGEAIGKKAAEIIFSKLKINEKMNLDGGEKFVKQIDGTMIYGGSVKKIN